jgi:Fe-only nitrogenase accessory protein AnfO
MKKKPAEIAVFVGENGNTAKFYGEGKIIVCKQEQGLWNVIREKSFSLKEIQGTIHFREKMEEILAFLDACRIFVALSFTGVPYYFLEKAKFSIWEYDGNPYDFLDYVLLQEQINDKKMAKKGQGENRTGEEGQDAVPENYSILINGIQGKSAKLTSKRLLLPFLRRGSFESLEIVCNHIPSWLEEEAFQRKLYLQIQNIGWNQVKIILKNQG